jgi:hypothetical protein
MSTENKELFHGVSLAPFELWAGCVCSGANGLWWKLGGFGQNLDMSIADGMFNCRQKHIPCTS